MCLIFKKPPTSPIFIFQKLSFVIVKMERLKSDDISSVKILDLTVRIHTEQNIARIINRVIKIRAVEFAP